MQAICILEYIQKTTAAHGHSYIGQDENPSRQLFFSRHLALYTSIPIDDLSLDPTPPLRPRLGRRGLRRRNAHNAILPDRARLHRTRLTDSIRENSRLLSNTRPRALATTSARAPILILRRRRRRARVPTASTRMGMGARMRVGRMPRRMPRHLTATAPALARSRAPRRRRGSCIADAVARRHCVVVRLAPSAASLTIRLRRRGRPAQHAAQQARRLFCATAARPHGRSFGTACA